MKPDSPCPHARALYHNWMVYKHNADWTVLGCFCSRCAGRTTMSSDDYNQVLIAATRAWEAFIAASKQA